MEQKKINDLIKQYQQDYDQSKLKYEVAKVFFYNMPFWRYVISFFIFTELFSVVYTLGYAIPNNQIDDKQIVSFLLAYWVLVPIWLTLFVMGILMCCSKPNKKYFDTVINQIDKKVQSKDIVLKETDNRQYIKNVVNKFFNTLNNNDQIIYYVDIGNLYIASRNDFRRAKNRLKNLDNKIDRMIKKQKQKENIQEYIKEYNCQ